jgi:hypothetical protein
VLFYYGLLIENKVFISSNFDLNCSFFIYFMVPIFTSLWILVTNASNINAMKTLQLIITMLLLACFSFPIMLQAQPMSAPEGGWQKSDFFGFDSIGDCRGSCGDISSVFARIEQNRLLLRITFDDMVIRTDNRMINDRFADSDLHLSIAISNRNKDEIIATMANLESFSATTKGFQSKRTPESNRWEAVFDLPQSVSREELKIHLSVLQNSEVIETFIGYGAPSRAAGNVAFVHHGNQGITYTEVFYGSPNGVSGMDGSGFDEVLQAHEATAVPGNFNMSGTLMPAAQWHNPEFNDWLKNLAASGLIEIMTSPLGQHIMPFVQNNMNDWSVAIAADMANFHYNYQPHSAWVPERVWLAPGAYPDAGVTDWPGNNWSQHGVWGVVLDDNPHLNGYDNRKIHWMNNGSGVDLRVIPINNSFVGNMHYSATNAKNQIAGMGAENLCVYGTDWEVAAEMNEHDGTFFLDNYESVLWWCHDNFPAVQVWKLTDAMQNSSFNGTGAEITPGTYGLLGGGDGYGGSNNSWYNQWAATPSHSDFHEPKWNYGFIWNDAYNQIMTAPDNNLSQLAWYILMINLHETGWHDGGTVAGWEHRYSSHIKNANVYSQAAHWAAGEYTAPAAAYFTDIDRDGTDEMVMHNQKLFAVFESIGGKLQWLFCRDADGTAHSLVGSDMAYWSESDGDYNESSNNHVAALSDVYPYQQDAIYTIQILQNSGDTVVAELSQYGVKKHIALTLDANYLDVGYNFFGGDGYIKSGFSPDLLDIIWSGKEHLQRMWGNSGSYCGQRNTASGATVALVTGNGGAQHNLQFEGTLVLGDEIKCNDQMKMRLFAGYTTAGAGTTAPELDLLAQQNMDFVPPKLNPVAILIDNNTLELIFDEAVEFFSSQNKNNYTLTSVLGSYTIGTANRQTDWRKVRLTVQQYWLPADVIEIDVLNVEDLNSNVITDDNTATLAVPSGATPHTISIDGTNDFDSESEMFTAGDYNLYITWDHLNLYIGFENFDLNTQGDFFVNIDVDQVSNYGASGGSWGRVSYAAPFRADYQIAIEGGGGSIQLNHWANGKWHYPANNNCQSYEGWADNGLTEIAVPWASMGNPNKVALSVHVSEEDNQMITAVFPSQNPVGNHPTLTHMYAFYPPYVPSEMPITGFVPNQAWVMPNQPPEFISWLPAATSLTITTADTIAFAVSASDFENDEIYYSWLVDGVPAATTPQFLFGESQLSAGIYTITAVITDSVPLHNPVQKIWHVEATPAVMQQFISVPAGWSGISLFVDPVSSDVATIFSSLTLNENLIILQNYSSMYWPGQNVNTIDALGGWNAQSGYQIKLHEAQQVVFEGTPVTNRSLSFEAPGWYLMPVLSPCQTDIVELFAGNTDKLLAIKEVAGAHLYWPGVFQNLYYLQPGKAYLAGVSAPVSIEFHDCNGGDQKTSDFQNSFSGTLSISNDAATPNTHVVVIAGEALEILAPDDALILTAGTEDISYKIQQQSASPVAFMLSGDDPFPLGQKGFIENENLYFIVSRGGNEYRLQPVFDQQFDAPVFKNNGMTHITGWTAQSVKELLRNDETPVFYPNPVKKNLYSPFFIAGSTIRIYNAQGRLTEEYQPDDTQIDVSHLPTGLYYFYIFDDNQLRSGKFVRQ